MVSHVLFSLFQITSSNTLLFSQQQKLAIFARSTPAMSGKQPLPSKSPIPASTLPIYKTSDPRTTRPTRKLPGHCFRKKNPSFRQEPSKQRPGLLIKSIRGGERQKKPPRPRTESRVHSAQKHWPRPRVRNWISVRECGRVSLKIIWERAQAIAWEKGACFI